MRREAEPLVAVSAGFRGVLDQAKAISTSPHPVLLLGETGVGKECVARFIHDQGPRRDLPFVAVNCAGISETLLLSEMFGHVRGAFTGADADSPGHLRVVAGGTLLLDEIGDLPPGAQAAMLRALDSLEVYPVGSTRPYFLEARVVAATNRDVETLLRDGGLRLDLYQRLACHVVRIPPLRERCEDIIPLAEVTLQSMCRRGEASGEYVGPLARQSLLKHYWPGNVRELRNAVTAAVYEHGPPGLVGIARVLSGRGSCRSLAVTASLAAAIGREPKELEVELLAALQSHGRCSIASLARLLNRDKDTVRRSVVPLVAAGIVLKGGRGRTGWIGFRSGYEETADPRG